MERTEILQIVRTLNKAFRRNKYSGLRLSAFSALLTRERGWLIVCSDFYTWLDNPAFQRIKKLATERATEFQFEFDGSKTFNLTKIMLLK